MLVFPVPLVLALLLNSLAGERLKRLLQSVLYLPHFLSWVIVVALFQQMLGERGHAQHLPGRSTACTIVQHHRHPDLFKALVTSQAIWKDAGWGTIIFLAAMSRIDQQQYEAAAIDGAGPLAADVAHHAAGAQGLIILLLILRLGDILSVGFEQILLQRDTVGRHASEVLDTYVYFNGILGGDWGMSAAAGLIKGVVGVAPGRRRQQVRAPPRRAGGLPE